MAQQYRDITQIRVWPNDKGMAKYGNSKWTPYKEGTPADVHLRGDVQYSIRVFENDDGSMTLKISEKVAYANTDSLAADVKQDGFKQVAEAAGVKHGSATSSLSLDDDVPF